MASPSRTTRSSVRHASDRGTVAGMHFFSAPSQKLTQFITATVALMLVVYVTFALAKDNFGDVPLPIAIERTVKKEAYTFYYQIRYSQDVPRAALSALFGSTVDFTRTPEVNAIAVPVLAYHEIVDEPDGENVTRRDFADQMFALKKAGWQTVTLEEFLAFMNGERELPDKSFLLTFDDGAKDSYYPVDPLLRVLEYTAVTFILTKHSVGEGSHYYLSQGEIADMLASGRWELGSHGHDSHAFLPVDEQFTLGAALANRLWLAEEGRVETPEEYAARVQGEMSGSKQLLEQTFERTISAFAFPFGDFGQLSINYPEAGTVVPQLAAREYSRAFYQARFGEAGTFNYSSEGEVPFLNRRIEVLPSWGAPELMDALDDGRAKALPFVDAFDENHGWRSVWGTFVIDDALQLQAGTRGTGNAAVLDGTGHLTDYRYEVDIGPGSGTGTLLWARFQDGNNNIACNFDEEFVHIEEMVQGEKRVAKGVRGTDLFPPSGATLYMEVNGRTVTCGINGTPVLFTDFIDPSLTRGSVGIKVWEEQPGIAALRIDQVSIFPLEENS